MRPIVFVACLTWAAASGCELGRASAFGQACASDATCGALRCHPEQGRCLPAPALDRSGATCERPASITTHAEDALWRARGTLHLTAENTVSGELSCGKGRVHYVSLTVPEREDEDKQPLPAIVVEVKASADTPVSVALLDSTCAESMPHACAEGAFDASSSFVLPWLPPGEHVVAIVAPEDDALSLDVQLELNQLACPPGFVPDVDGCRGFVAIPGPEPRVRHELLPISTRSAVVVGGVAPNGRADVQVFDRRVLLWSTALLPEDFEEPCAFLSARGELFVYRGAPSDSVGAVALSGFRGFADVPGSASVSGIGDGEDCLAVPLSEPDLALVLGGSEPEVVTRIRSLSILARQCMTDIMCESDEVCLARFPSTTSGTCTCVGGACASNDEGLASEEATGSDVLRHLRGMTALVLPSAPGDAAVLVLGGVGDRGAIDPWVYLERERLWVPTTLTLTPRTFADVAQIGDVATLVGGIAQGGGDPLGPGAGSDVVELIALGANRFDETRLASPRRDSALGAYSDHEAIVVGGRRAREEPPLATTEIVDVRSGSVRSGPVVPEPVYGHRAVALGEELLVAGGKTVDDRGVTNAYLLVRVEAGLRPAIGLESFISSVGGDTCADAVDLAEHGGASGDLLSTTLGRRRDYYRGDFLDCGAALDSLDAVFRIDLVAGARVVFEVTPTQRDVSVALAALNACPADERSAVACTDGAGLSGGGVLDITAETDGSVFLVVTRSVSFQDQNHLEERPFGFRLRWNVEAP